ncbi:MAG: hypothetical protein FJ379_09440 [Verrucomicrobia bacterium]|nr:hypothetical protein [Verrucomicrobiota bacterium]
MPRLGNSNPDPRGTGGTLRPGTGSWTPVEGGSFEITRGELAAWTGYVLDGNWQLVLPAGSGGTARIDGTAAARGTNGVVISPGTFTGPGIALTLGATMSLPRGVPHVLSEWVRRPNPSNSKATMHLDLWDVPGDIFVFIPSGPGWQFVHGGLHGSELSGGDTGCDRWERPTQRRAAGG